MREACTDDAVLHALRTVPDKEFKALRQAIFDKADLRWAAARLKREQEWIEKARREQETMKLLEKARLNELLIQTVVERDEYFSPHHQQAIRDAITDDAV